MKLLATALALSLSIGATSAIGAQVPTGATPERVGAILIEWTIANCPGARVPAVSAMAASMVLNGSAPEVVEPLRIFMREGVKANYPDMAAACADMTARIPRQ